MIRALDPFHDSDAILGLYCRTADYVSLEFGRSPDAALVAEYFADAPPKGDPATSLKLGLFENGCLLGVADVAFGYPEPQDAYLGRMMLASEAQGAGRGRRFLHNLEAIARSRGATRLLLSVLEANPRGRAFWEREGFGKPMTYPPMPKVNPTQVWIRLEKPI